MHFLVDNVGNIKLYYGLYRDYRVITPMDNIQQIADAVQKGRQLIVWASVQQGRTRLTRLRNELFSNSFHAVFA